MKPSDRIQQLYQGELNALHRAARYHVEQSSTAHLQLALRALSLYLDEQAELEQRRVHVRNALAMVSQACRLSTLNEQLEAAGLTCRCELGDSLELTWRAIADEAEREGLL